MDLNFSLWAVGGQDTFRPQWHHSYKDTNYVVYVVDSDVRNSVEEANTKFNKLMNEEEMRDAAVLVLC